MKQVVFFRTKQELEVLKIYIKILRIFQNVDLGYFMLPSQVIELNSFIIVLTFNF